MKERQDDPEREIYNRELGARLVVARKGTGATAAAVAKALGMPVNTYLKHERGDRQFPMHRVLDFCLLTGASPAFIVTGRLPDEWRIGTETGRFKRPKLPTQQQAK